MAVYDSLYPSLPLDCRKQICSLWKPKSDHVKFLMADIYKQPNCSDCGLFAIACATELAHAKNPQICTWDVCQMRPHLAMCLESGRMQRFPIIKQRRLHASKIITESVYCVCRMPNDPNSAMIRCDKCRAWYHNECLNVELDDDMLNNTWFCCNCSSV